MQSEQCNRQWRKCRKGGAGRTRCGWWLSLGAARVVRRCWAWVVAGCGARRVGGSRRGRVLGVGRVGLVWGQKKPRQALEACKLLHAERTVLPAVAQSKQGGGVGLAGPSWAWAVVGCGARRVVALAGGEGWGARVVRGGVSNAACRGCRVWELNCLQSRAGLLVSVACGGGRCVLLPVSNYEEVMRVKTAWGLRPVSLGREWGAGGGLSPAGMAGVPWGPVGAEAPHVAWVRNHGLYFRHRSY